jgi:hypothetical protein
MLNHTIRDRISFRSSLAPLRDPAFRVLAGLQDVDQSLQIEALALAFTILTQGAGLDAHELVARARRQIADADRVDTPHLEAISDFAKGELS